MHRILRVVAALALTLGLTAGVQLSDPEPASASHPPASYVCQYYTPHGAYDTVYYAVWHTISAQHNWGIVHCTTAHFGGTHEFTVWWDGRPNPDVWICCGAGHQT